MPELPEVETICRGIRPHVLARTVCTIWHDGKQLRQPVPMEALHKHILGGTIIDVQRRAKYILMEFDSGDLLAIHLGMTGNLGLFTPDSPPSKHCHLGFSLSDGMELRYTDIRRFGSIAFIARDERHALEETFFRTTGPEPFADKFSASYLRQKAAGRSIPVKTFIMTNQIVAGVGNIYANESLFMAGISPKKSVHRISRAAWQRLVTAIREVLDHAIACGGSTISDYVNADQESGYFQINFKVYGKAGEPCSVCGTPIGKEQIGGRASFFCPLCQK